VASNLHDTAGRLIYAIGDIHGRADLAMAMVDQIIEDCEGRRDGFADRPMIVFLGDYVDRGRQSREVIDFVLDAREDDRFEVRCLLGNHEEAMLDFMDRRTGGSGWAKRGGKATLESYGVRVPFDPDDRAAWSAAREQLLVHVPPAHVAFLRALEMMIICGDILFVHAGVRPGVALDKQDKTDMLWIRSEFLTCEEPFEKLIVHGHTPIEHAFMGPHRIGLDTGAYASGLLSAARFDGSAPALIEVRSGPAVLAKAS
jgi:serine/threonine protein phosphatase 1